ncbi:Branched-chain amino acid aminotransferase 2, chloroplastic-like protein [Drosera capensis]
MVLTMFDLGHVMLLASKVFFNEIMLDESLPCIVVAKFILFMLREPLGLFEGLKAYRKQDGSILLFRPEENALRLRNGAERMCMVAPTVDRFVDAVKETVLANERWIPPPVKGSLYISPLLMGRGSVLTLEPSPEYTFLICVSPVGNHFKEGLAPINLLIETTVHRASPGGTGGAKNIGIYAPVTLPAFVFLSGMVSFEGTVGCQSQGIILYLDYVHKKYLEEVSSCNVFVVKVLLIFTLIVDSLSFPSTVSIWQCYSNSSNKRDNSTWYYEESIIDVARNEGFEVEERYVTVDELLNADGVFCMGTAVVVLPVGSITYLGERVTYGKGSVGSVAQQLYTSLTRIQMGLTEDKMGRVGSSNSSS